MNVNRYIINLCVQMCLTFMCFNFNADYKFGIKYKIHVNGIIFLTLTECQLLQ